MIGALATIALFYSLGVRNLEALRKPVLEEEH